MSSVGIIPHRLPFTASNTSIKTFRHAVSLDERRAKFKANLFNRPTKAEQQLGTQPGEMPKAGAEIVTINSESNGVKEVDTGVQTGSGIVNGSSGVNGKKGSKMLNGKGSTSGKRKQRDYEAEFSKADGHQPHETDVLEVWFAGCHCGEFRCFVLL